MTQHSHSLLPAYEKYIEGDYYQNSELRKAFTTKRQEIWDLLREGYPDPKSPRDLYDWKRDSKYPRDLKESKRDENKRIKVNTAQTYPKGLVTAHIISRWINEEDKDSHIEVKKYYFEDYNYLLNQKNDFKYPFAPGYVQYTKNFLNKYEKIRNEELEDKVYNSLMEFLIDAMPKIRRRSLRLCSGCGYNHETRDLIRATLLHLIDGLETNRRFIKFIEDDVHEDTYKQLVAMSEVETSKPTEVIKHSINDHQTKGYLLLKKKRALDEESPSYLLGARPPSTDAVKEGMRTILITGSGILKVLLHGEISDIIYNENEVCRVYPDAKDGAALIYFKDYKIYNPPKIIKDEIVMRLMTEFKYNTRDSLYFINEEMFDQLI